MPFAAKAFLDNLVYAVPYKIHTVLMDNGAPSCIQPTYHHGATARYVRPRFDLSCDHLGIEHRLTKPKHRWTNGQVERTNRTIQVATVRGAGRYHYESLEPLKAYLLYIATNPEILTFDLLKTTLGLS